MYLSFAPGSWLRREGIWALGALLLFVVGVVTSSASVHWPAPKTDLLREVVAYAWDYDYSRVYPFSPGLPKFDPYIGFDVLAGVITQASSPQVSLLVVQAAILALYIALFALLMREQKLPVLSTVLLWTVLLGGPFVVRLVQARPEMLATLWLLSAIRMRPLLWVALGTLLSPTYWLMPLYALGGLLLSVSWRKRVLFTCAAAAATSAFWLAYAGPAWLTGLAHLGGLAQHRLVPVSEDAPLWSAYWSAPGTWLVWGLLATSLLLCLANTKQAQWRATFERVAPFLLLAVVLLAAGRARHIAVLLPVLTIASLHLHPLLENRVSKILVLVLALICGMQYAKSVEPFQTDPQFKFPAHSRVLTSAGSAVFFVPFANPQPIEVLPSIETGWDTEESKQLVLALVQGTLTCAQLRAMQITHIVARMHLNPVAGCTRSLAVEPPWVAYEVTETR